MTTSNRKTTSDNQWPVIRFAEGEKKWMVDSRTKDGGSRRFFATKTIAQSFAQECRIARHNSGTSIFGNVELARYGKTISDAIAFYLAHLRRQESSVTVNHAIATFQEYNSKNKELSKRSTKNLRVGLAQFAATFGEEQIGTIESATIAAWLDALPVGKSTRNTIRALISPLFSFAKRRKWRTENPFSGGSQAEIAHIDLARPKPRILTVKESADLLSFATDETCAFWAISLFAGLRPDSELKRLRWEHIHLDENVLIVDGDESEAESTKTGRRVVKISDNLASWLRPLAKTSGMVAPTVSFWKKLQADKRKVGFGTPGTETDKERKAGLKLRKWVADITRHSFISYHLAEHGDIGVTSTQAGNSPNIVKRHYLSLVRPASAALYWSILPSETPSNIVAISA
jgi:integrase